MCSIFSSLLQYSSTLAVTILFCLLCSVASASSFEMVMSRCNSLAALSCIRPISSGKSFEGRPIPAYLITDFDRFHLSKVRILVLAGQHGSEPNPVWSAVSLMRKLASGNNRNLLRRCLFVVVPVANPDGFERRSRENAQGLDINRDWKNFRTLEARFVDSLIEKWKPHILIDLHEWTAVDSSNANEIELPWITTPSRRWLVQDFVRPVASQLGISVAQSSESSNLALFHRHYTTRGFTAFLVETRAGVDPAKKRRLYEDLILAVAHRASYSDCITDISPSARGFYISTVRSYLQPPVTESDDGWTGQLLLLIGAVFCILVYAARWSEGDTSPSPERNVLLVMSLIRCNPRKGRTSSYSTIVHLILEYRRHSCVYIDHLSAR